MKPADYSCYKNEHFHLPSANKSTQPDPNSQISNSLQWETFSHEPLELIQVFRELRTEWSNPHHPKVKAWNTHLITSVDFENGFAGFDNDVQSEKAILVALVSWINEFVFEDALSPTNFEFVFVDRLNIKRRPNLNIYGKNKKNRHLPGTTAQNVKCKTTIYELSGTMNCQERLFTYIGTALHEMLHAIVAIYCYKCPGNVDHQRHVIGCTGHGPLWAILAEIVESIANSMGFCGINIGRHHSIALEMNKRGIELEFEDWRDWGLKANDVAMVLEELSRLALPKAKSDSRKRKREIGG